MSAVGKFDLVPVDNHGVEAVQNPFVPTFFSRRQAIPVHQGSWGPGGNMSSAQGGFFMTRNNGIDAR